MNDITLSLDNLFRFGKNVLEMIVNVKIKKTAAKKEQNKFQYNLERQKDNISASLSGNVDTHDFLTGKYVLSEKGFLEKAAKIKQLEYPPLGNELQ